MKRTGIALWMGILLLLLSTVSAGAQEKTRVTLTADRGIGQEIVLTIGVRDVSFNVLQLAVAYDPEKLTPLSVWDGEPAEDGLNMTKYLAPESDGESGWLLCEYGAFDRDKGVVELTAYVDPESKNREGGADADGYIEAGAGGMDLVSLHFTLKTTAAFTADTIKLTTTENTEDHLILSVKDPKDPTRPVMETGRGAAERDFTALGVPLSETAEPEESGGTGSDGSGGTTGSGSGSGTNTGGFGGGTGGESQPGTGQQPGQPNQQGQGSPNGETTQNGQSNGSVTADALSDMQGHWAERYVRDLVNRGLVSGYPGGGFQPEQQLSRGEFCAVLCKMTNRSPKSGDSTFADVRGNWAEPYINVLYAEGKVSGVGAGRFAPDRPISRQEVAKLLSDALVLPASETEWKVRDADQIADWAQAAMKSAVAAGLFHGYEDGTLRPEGLMVRGEMAAVVSHGLALLEQK